MVAVFFFVRFYDGGLCKAENRVFNILLAVVVELFPFLVGYSVYSMLSADLNC